MKKFIISILFLFFSFANAKDNIEALFPDISELPGGSDHWIANFLPANESKDCKVYSATYAYFAESSQTLFGIARSSVYSVNIRFHVCSNISDAIELYKKFELVGEKDRRRNFLLGDAGFIYVEPDASGYTGDFYLTSRSKYVVLQVHSDDGFVLVDIASIMSARLEDYLSIDAGSVSDGITLKISGDGYENSRVFIPFNIAKGDNIELSGIVYDQYNQRVPGAEILISETGLKINTDKAGEFKVSFGDKKGNSLKLFYPFNINKIEQENLLGVGHYLVDIYYKNSGKTSEDTWQIIFSEDDTFRGVSMNSSTGGKLYFSGRIEDGTLIVDRPCGSGMISKCVQRFKGNLREDIIEGTWTGNGGGGTWRLYKNSFELKKMPVSFENVGIKVSGYHPDSKGGFIVGSDKYIELVPSYVYNDFNFYSANLHIKAESDMDGVLPFVLYSSNWQELHTVSYSPYVSFPGAVETTLDISPIFMNAYAIPYYIGLLEDSVTGDVTALNLEMTYAVPIKKLAIPGSIKLEGIDFKGPDYAGSSKLAQGNGKPDIVIKLKLFSYGIIINSIEVVSLGKDNRRWSTRSGNASPSPVVLNSEGLILNNADGTIFYSLDKFNDDISIHLDKGSTIDSWISGFEIIFSVDGEKISYKVPIK